MIETVAVSQSVDYSFQKGEKGHPERMARRLYQQGNRARLPAEIPPDARLSLAELLSLYRPNDSEYGENSLVNLFPTKHDFEALTIKGLDLVCKRSRVKVTVHINTIDQLRGLFEVLDDNPTIRVFIHEPLNGTRIRVILNPLREKLNSWDRSFIGQH